MSGNAVIYVRVSTEDQAESGLSIQAQEAACRAFAARNGWPVVAVCADAGVSGSRPLRKRPGLKEAISLLGEGDYLIVAKRDRLLRCDHRDRSKILTAIEARVANLKSTAGEGTESDTPECWFMAWILDGMAYMELLKGKQRTRAVMAQKRTNGERCGQLPYGLRLAADGKTVEPDPEADELVDACRRLRAEGRSLRGIAGELAALGFRPKRGAGGFGVSTIRRLLTRGDGPACPKT